MRIFLVGALCVAAADCHATEPSTPVEGSAAAPVMVDLPDSLTTIYVASPDQPLELEAQEVRARRITRDLGADRVELGPSLIESRDAGSVADLGALLPSTQLTVNSRGESLFMVRGASERHLRVELDGIPLTLPWDERMDLGVLPLVAVGQVVAFRGVSSALDAPNTLAGRIELSTREQPIQGWTTRLGGWIGEGEAWGTQALHLRRDDVWTSTFAIEHRRRAGFLLSEDADTPYHQDPTRRLRLNSDREQTALLGRIAREFGATGRANLLVQAFDTDQGVAPETHEESARFWRYPKTQRLLVGTSGGARHGDWHFDATASFDAYAQDIERYAADDYATVEATEEGHSRTWLGRARVDRDWSPRLRTSVAGSWRGSRHEIEEAPLPSAEYQQRLASVAAEVLLRPNREWRLRGGAGYERASTPQTGNVSARDAEQEATLHAAIEHDVHERGRAHISVARRPRFASMRELFSDALDRFDVNPDLRSEMQVSAETGLSWRFDRGELMANAFVQEVDGAIERVRISAERRQRVNLDTVRHLGVEVGGVWRPARGVTLDLQHTVLRSRAKTDTGFDARVEDRPAWITSLAASYVHPRGLRLRNELTGLGPRYSLGDGLQRLAAALRWNARISWQFFGSGGLYSGAECFARLDNILDAANESQVGLPEAGRTLRLGMRFDLQR